MGNREMFHNHVWNTWKANRLHILPLPSMGFPFGRDLHMYPRGVCSISMLVFWEVTNHTKQLLFLQSSVSRHNHPSFQKSLGERLLLKKNNIKMITPTYTGLKLQVGVGVHFPKSWSIPRVGYFSPQQTVPKLCFTVGIKTYLGRLRW